MDMSNLYNGNANIILYMFKIENNQSFVIIHFSLEHEVPYFVTTCGLGGKPLTLLVAAELSKSKAKYVALSFNYFSLSGDSFV